MKTFKKLGKHSLALLLGLILCFGLLSMTAFALPEVSGPGGELEITKAVVDKNGNPLEGVTDKFTFTLELNYPFWSAPRKVTITLPDSAGNWTWTGKLSAGISYKVTEADVDGYILFSSEGTTGTIAVNGKATAKFVNKVDEPEYGSLTVGKNLVDEDGNEILWEPGEEFTFTVEFTDPDSGEKNTETFTLTYENPSKTFEGLTDGTTYKVTEVEADGYTLVASEGTEGKIVVDETAAAVFTNKADENDEEPEYGSLTVSKTVVNRSGELTDALRSQQFTFTVNLTYPDGTTETRTFTLSHGGSETIGDLPDGTTYTVTEANVEGYVSSGTVTGTIEADQTKTAAFSNTTWTELPDPNDPDSPDEVTIIEDGVPKTYEKVWDDEEEEWVYIDEDYVPLVPATGDPFSVWPCVAVLSAAGLFCLLVIAPKKSKQD